MVKYLDSAIRLPAQAHPDKDFSRAHFHSEYGKTESWIVLGTRENAKIFFGFKDGVDEKAFRLAIADSEFDKDAMEKLMKSGRRLSRAGKNRPCNWRGLLDSGDSRAD